VRTVQMRLKDHSASEVRAQIRDSMAICRDYDCQLIVNDHWRAALDLGCDFIHLGQEDLAVADLSAIKRAGVRFGLSTHDESERAIALAAKPDYIALGPVYETKLKAMRWAPQGLDRVAEWKAAIGDLPLAAIGGITPERAGGVLAAGADSVAVITDFFMHAEPEARVRDWLAWAKYSGEQPSGARGTVVHTSR
jgi:thiamine-phosphate pyrophosphorylase